MTCSQTSTLGVYLLGALEPEERSTFESHLYGCDICRAELVRLAPLPGLLNQITVADFEDTVEEPVPPLEPVGDEEEVPAVAELPPLVEYDTTDTPQEPDTPKVRRLRRRYWQIATAAAAVVVLTIGGILGYQALWGTGANEPRTVTWSATNPVTGASAKVELTEREWGTEVKVWMDHLPAGRECRLVVKAKYPYHQKPEPYYEVAGWWGTGQDARDQIPGSTSIEIEDINRLEVMDGDVMLVGIPSPA